ncbi:MAG: TRAP transporter substrate-binding protein [Pseudomonadota bacterium]
MRLRNFILATTALATGSLVSSTASAADYVLKLAHNGPEQHPFQDGAVAFKEALETATDGAVEVQIFPGEQLGSEEETAQMLKLGTIACSVQSAGGGLAPFVPEADLFNLPFLFSDTDHFYRVVDGEIGASVAGKVEEQLDVKFLGWWFSGVRNAWNDTRPVVTPSDLEGLKIRVMGSPVLIDTFNTLGAQATPMSFGEVYTSLQQGVIDGAETDHVDLLVENFFEVTKYVSLTGHMYLAAGFVCSESVFSDLPESVQAAIVDAAATAAAAERAAMASATEEALAALMEKGIEFNEVDLAAFREQAKSVYAANAERVGGMAMIDAVVAE